ncbi:hypothetical protein VTN77DRAFT_6260 [Rasamsonia byssochlamydoides]|uniref:uncharacterized protein n=1 Tax=Rasamsonia byssochlamydoides TaxID=89139 RepID=UPI00374328CF
MTTLPVLIIGAGISGLTLAQYLRRQGIPFRIFERDASMTSRVGGWGLTIHWAHSLLCNMLPAEVVQRLEESHVTREALETGDYGRFTLFDLSTGVAKYNVPAAKRMRFSRGKLREILAMGIEIEWSKRLKAVDSLDDMAIAHFEDGTSVQGCLVVGCDGSRSRLRQIMYPSSYQNRPIPVRMLGVTPRYSVEQAAGARAIDPYFFQGTHRESGVYLFFSFLETPHSSGNQTTDYLCQIVMSWPTAKGIAIPASNEERIAVMRQLAADWAEPFRSLVQNIPADAEATSINIDDWLPDAGAHGRGRMLLMGDAAHTMTMFRGEGANQAVADVNDFALRLAAKLKPGSDVSLQELRALIDEYEDDVLKRVQTTVEDSRRACLHAHHLDLVDEESPLVARRLQQARAQRQSL